MYYAEIIARLIEELNRLPGVGPKTAQRLAFHLLRRPYEEVRRLAEAMVKAREGVRRCSQCCNLTDIDPCRICRDERRDRSLICVLEGPADVVAVEKTREYRGLYHVLHGSLSPVDGVGPDDLCIKELLERVGRGGVREVVLATNPDVKGEATALYLARLLKPLGVVATRLARGLPVGGDLEYADEVTLARALEFRREV
ncbi:MAG: recombination mediator RecR [Acetobacteraceae bacterium]|nr:recombination mediator RecR [Acetobacteraceae bacterium]